jgi:hypothetical protein
MQKPRPKEAPAPRQQRPTRETGGSTKGASAPFVIPEGETTNRPASWEAIRVGDLVIAHESPEDGWWEAIVVAVENDQLLLRWRDYPRQPCVRRGRFEVALLPPVAA